MKGNDSINLRKFNDTEEGNEVRKYIKEIRKGTRTMQMLSRERIMLKDTLTRRNSRKKKVIMRRK